jgi:uncharacterized membrane protein YcaP (DUF421 family)
MGVEWGKLFIPNAPFLEIVVRGTLVYLVLFAMFRFLLKRQTGALGISDLLVVVLVADAAQNAMAGTYTSISDGLLLIAVIMLWALALDWLGFRFPRLQRLIRPAPLPLVQDGRLIRPNMAKELISEDELLSQLRLQGVEDLADVKIAALEPDGRISVVLRRRDERRSGGRTRRRF